MKFIRDYVTVAAVAAAADAAIIVERIDLSALGQSLVFKVGFAGLLFYLGTQMRVAWSRVPAALLNARLLVLSVIAAASVGVCLLWQLTAVSFAIAMAVLALTFWVMEAAERCFGWNISSRLGLEPARAVVAQG